jgi:hypothetical protein
LWQECVDIGWMVYVEVSVGNSPSKRKCRVMDCTVYHTVWSPTGSITQYTKIGEFIIHCQNWGVYYTLPVLGTEILSVCIFLQCTSLYQLQWGIFVLGKKFQDFTSSKGRKHFWSISIIVCTQCAGYGQVQPNVLKTATIWYCVCHFFKFVF